jgi:hypothetical protein
MMDGLRLEDFEGGVGEAWEIEAAGARVPLRLDVAQKLPRSHREEGAFRLEWVGPGPLLPQSIYRFHRGEGSCEMFIVPIAKEGEGYRYEAIFN